MREAILLRMMRKLYLPGKRATAFCLCAAVALLLFSGGCTSEATKTPEGPRQAVKPQDAPPVDSRDVPETPPQPEPDPAEVFAALAEKAAGNLEAGALEDARAALDELTAVYEEPNAPSDEQQALLASLDTRLAEALAARADEQRAAKLVEAEQLMDL